MEMNQEFLGLYTKDKMRDLVQVWHFLSSGCGSDHLWWWSHIACPLDTGLVVVVDVY